MSRKLLLSCGILASLLYAGFNGVIPQSWPGCSPVSQTVSKRFAIGAYTFLTIAFACDVWKSADQNWLLRITAALRVYGTLNLLWPFAPMHMRPDLAAGHGKVSDTQYSTGAYGSG